MLYRNKKTNRIESLPFRVRLPDGSTLTDPEQWSSNPEALAAAGFEVTERTPEDDAVDAAAALESAKAAKLSEVESVWQARTEAGWAVPGKDYSLGIGTEDITLLLGAYTLSVAAAAAGFPDVVGIIDTNGGIHRYGSQELTSIMLQYGSARSALSEWYAAMQEGVASAETITEIEAISVE